jgi:hypothetical protein
MVQFLALIRILAEYFRLQYVLQDRFSMAIAQPYVGAALATAVLCAIAVGLYFLGRYRLVTVVAGLTVAALLTYKLAFMS